MLGIILTPEQAAKLVAVTLDRLLSRLEPVEIRGGKLAGSFFLNAVVAEDPAFADLIFDDPVEVDIDDAFPPMTDEQVDIYADPWTDFKVGARQMKSEGKDVSAAIEDGALAAEAMTIDVAVREDPVTPKTIK